MLRDSVKGRVRERAKRVCVILGSCSCRVFGSRSTFSRSRTLARCRPTRPALPRSATRARVHTCGTRVAHTRTHARCSSLPAGVAWRPRSASSCRRPGRPGFPAPRPRLPRRRPPPLLAPWPPLPVAFGSPPSDSQRWAFSEPPVPFPRPGPLAGPSAPHARPWPTRPAAPVARASARRVASLAEDERGSSSPDPRSRLVSHPRFGEYSLWSSFFP